MVFDRFFKGAKTRRNAEALYDRIVEQSRNPDFYQKLAVKDDLEGRFDLLVLHAHLVIRRLGQFQEADARELSQTLFDAMFHDMDRSLRVMGVGDMSVGKRIKDMVRAFYGRGRAYEEALGQGEGQADLEEVLVRNLYGGQKPECVGQMASYVRETVMLLEDQAFSQFQGGQLGFAEPGGAE